MNHKLIPCHPCLRKTLIGLILTLALTMAHASEQTLVSSSANQQLKLTLLTPRPFGYHAGDIIAHRIHIQHPFGADLDTTQIPGPGPLSDWLDIVRVNVQDLSSTEKQLLIAYQVAKSVKTSEWLEIPSFRINLQSGSNDDTASVPAWKFAYSTVIPTSTRDSEIVAQPPQPLESLSTQPTLRKLLIYAIGAALSVMYFLWRQGHLQLWTRQNRPFQNALKALKQLPAHPQTTSELEQTYRIVHQAFNDTARQTILESQLDYFFNTYPRFKPLQTDTRQFFQQSRTVFYESGSFMQNGSQQNPLPGLNQLCKRFERLEKQR
ncbi:MAG: hypothetical protein K0U68_08185 [Gammaproteobacteria bacterium]|nr:hypothetical protein [Gammaproteobacteria bacterium]